MRVSVFRQRQRLWEQTLAAGYCIPLLVSCLRNGLWAAPDSVMSSRIGGRRKAKIASWELHHGRRTGQKKVWRSTRNEQRGCGAVWHRWIEVYIPAFRGRDHFTSSPFRKETHFLDAASTMDVASIRTAQTTVRASRNILQRPPHTLAPLAATIPTRPSRPSLRTLTTTNTNRYPGPGLFGGSSASGGGGGGSGLGSSYFQRPSLPTNTIVRFVPQQTAWLVERMGRFHRILQPGLAVLIPFIDRIAYVKSLKEAAMEIPSQSAITADNVTLELDGVLYTRVDDAYKAR